MPTSSFGIIAPHPPILLPEVGKARAYVTSASLRAMERASAMLRAFAPDTVVVMSPHSPALGDAFAVDTAELHAGDLSDFGVPGLRLSYRGDPEFAYAVIEAADREGVPVVDRALVPMLRSGTLDHGVTVPMSFLDPDSTWPLVTLSLSHLPLPSHRALGGVVAEVARALGRRVAFIASGDCSHRLTPDAPAGFSVRGKEFDAVLVDLVAAGDLRGLMDIDEGIADEAGECGLRSFVTLGGFIREPDTRVLAYEGPWGVGYLTAVAAPKGELDALLASATPDTGAAGGMPGTPEGELPALARKAIETYVRDRRVIEAPLLSDPELPARAGVFVNLHAGGELRGCIGTICPSQATLAEEVVHNAIEAATADPRFDAVSADELAGLSVKVDVLHEAESCEMADLDPRTYGVIVSCDRRRGLLLPDLEGIDTADQQISIARRKAGIGLAEHVRLERFRVDRHE